MDSGTWAEVDGFLGHHVLQADPVLDRVLAESARAGLPPIQVAPLQGKLLHLLARMIGASRVLEIGTLGGYSAIWLARALAPGGTLLTLELEDKHADLAEANFREAGLVNRITVVRGPALRSLDRLSREGVEDFDLVFIDADKQSCAEYFLWAVRHTRVGGLILVDNIARGGAVADPKSKDESVLGVRRFFDAARQHPSVDFTAIQTVGVKGYDGLAIGLVIEKR